jgi:START domain
MPYDASSQYFKSKKVMVVSSRDMALIGKQIRISAKETYLYAKSITLDSVPPVKNIVRAETPISGWRIK